MISNPDRLGQTPPPLDGVFLDLYGTLTTGDRAAVEGVCAALVRDYRLPLSAHDLSILWGTRFLNALDHHNDRNFMTLYELEIKTLRAVMLQLGADADPVPYVDMLQAYWKAPPLHDEVVEILAALPCPICIVSNADRADAEAVLATHRLDAQVLVTSEDARHYKPHREIFEIALRLTGWRRDRVIHVGDSLHSDVGGARAAGIRSAWLNRVGRIHDIGEHEPHHAFTNLREFLAWTSGLTAG